MNFVINYYNSISLTDCYLLLDTVSWFQVDFKHNRLQSTKRVVKVSKIDATQDPQVDSS